MDEIKKNKKENKKAYNPEVTREDIDALGKKNMSMDSKDDRVLEEREEPVDFAASELDLPKAEDRTPPKTKGIKDEENRVHSLGGERRESLEERKDSEISRNIDPRRKAKEKRDERLNKS